MRDYLTALTGLRTQHAGLLRRLESGEFRVLERTVKSMQTLKAEQIARLQGIIAQLDSTIDQVEKTIAQMTNAGQL